MTKAVLKKRIHDIIDNSDEEVLKVIYTILKPEAQTEFYLTESEVKEMDLRWKNYKEGKEKVYTVNEIKKQLKRKKKS